MCGGGGVSDEATETGSVIDVAGSSSSVRGQGSPSSLGNKLP